MDLGNSVKVLVSKSVCNSVMHLVWCSADYSPWFLVNNSVRISINESVSDLNHLK